MKLNVPAMVTGHYIETCIVIPSFLLFAVQSSKSLNFWLYIDNTIYRYRLPWWLNGKETACNAGEEMQQELWVWSLGQEDPLERGMATHASILAWEIPWIEEPGRLQSMGLQKKSRHDLATKQQQQWVEVPWSLWLQFITWNECAWRPAGCFFFSHGLIVGS